MFNAILLAQDDGGCMAVENLATESKQVWFQKTLRRFPQAFELVKIINACIPDLIFLDLDDWESALAAAADIRTLAPKVAIIGFGGGWDSRNEAQCEAAGINELLVSPVTLKKFQDSVDRAIHKVRSTSQENLLAFLPAKAGSGCTTIALNLAGRLADQSRQEGLRKILLIEGDLHSGIISELLGVKPMFSVLDVLEHSSQLDYSQWSKYVTSSHGLDLLLSNRKRKPDQPSWANYHHLLDFAATRYDNILVDLPEVINDATVEIVRRAKQVFIVCTPEMASLTLAPQRCQELRSRGIPPEKILVLLNRWRKGEPTAADVEGLLNHGVSSVFGNDYWKVCAAARKHAFVDPSTNLGKSFAAFARKLSGAPETSYRPKLGFLRGLASKPLPQS